MSSFRFRPFKRLVFWLSDVLGLIVALFMVVGIVAIALSWRVRLLVLATMTVLAAGAGALSSAFWGVAIATFVVEVVILAFVSLAIMAIGIQRAEDYFDPNAPMSPPSR